MAKVLRVNYIDIDEFSHLDDLESNRTFFVDLISQLRVKYADGRILKPTKVTNPNASSTKAVSKTLDLNSLISRLLLGGKKR